MLEPLIDVLCRICQLLFRLLTCIDETNEAIIKFLLGKYFREEYSVILDALEFVAVVIITVRLIWEFTH